MSESALQRRIYTIQRCDKLKSYVLVSDLHPLDLQDDVRSRLTQQHRGTCKPAAQP